MKNVIIIHGCPPSMEKSIDPKVRTYDKHWIPWLKNKLEIKGIKTETPLMPEPWAPNYKKFKYKYPKKTWTTTSPRIIGIINKLIQGPTSNRYD